MSAPHADDALFDLLDRLRADGYGFVTPTPATHARVVARPSRQIACSLADVLGWSLPFRAGMLDARIHRLLDAAGMLITDANGLVRSLVRISSLHGRLFVHSAFPTEAEDAVFFGPDSYRFADLVAAEIGARSRGEGPIVDIGTGAGVGAIVAGLRCPGCPIVMTDINPLALRFARINARAAGLDARFLLGEGLDEIAEPIGLAIANPPYIVDRNKRAYRDGGGMHGAEAALTMSQLALPRLRPDGRFILYTGSPILDGTDPLAKALAALAAEAGRSFRYREIDPDVFGEELDQPAYDAVDRIAVVAAVFGPRA